MHESSKRISHFFPVCPIPTSLTPTLLFHHITLLCTHFFESTKHGPFNYLTKLKSMVLARTCEACLGYKQRSFVSHFITKISHNNFNHAFLCSHSLSRDKHPTGGALDHREPPSTTAIPPFCLLFSTITSPKHPCLLSSSLPPPLAVSHLLGQEKKGQRGCWSNLLWCYRHCCRVAGPSHRETIARPPHFQHRFVPSCASIFCENSKSHYEFYCVE